MPTKRAKPPAARRTRMRTASWPRGDARARPPHAGADDAPPPDRALSASELARRLRIRFGSAQYHLRSLERAGIALRVGRAAVEAGPRSCSRFPTTSGRRGPGHAGRDPAGDEPCVRRRDPPQDGRGVPRTAHDRPRRARDARGGARPGRRRRGDRGAPRVPPSARRAGARPTDGGLDDVHCGALFFRVPRSAPRRRVGHERRPGRQSDPDVPAVPPALPRAARLARRRRDRADRARPAGAGGATGRPSARCCSRRRSPTRTARRASSWTGWNSDR